MHREFDIVLKDEFRHQTHKIAFGPEKTDGFTRYRVVSIFVDGEIKVAVGDRVCVIRRDSGATAFCMRAYSVQFASRTSKERVIIGIHFLPGKIKDWHNQFNQQQLIRNAGSSCDIGMDSTLDSQR